MTVCDLGCASSVVCAERFRTAAKSFTAGAHIPAVMHASWRKSDQRAGRPDLDILRGLKGVAGQGEGGSHGCRVSWWCAARGGSCLSWRCGTRAWRCSGRCRWLRAGRRRDGSRRRSGTAPRPAASVRRRPCLGEASGDVPALSVIGVCRSSHSPNRCLFGRRKGPLQLTTSTSVTGWRCAASRWFGVRRCYPRVWVGAPV